MWEGVSVYFNFISGKACILGNVRITCSDTHLGIFAESFSNMECLEMLVAALLKKELVKLQFAGQEVDGIITYIDGGNDKCLTVNVAISSGESNG